MDFFKELIEFNNQIELKKLSMKKYTIDSDEDEEDIEIINRLRIQFMKDYIKVNNRQFQLRRPQKLK